MDREDESFVELLTGSQPALYSCILSLVPDRSAAQDILQETNLTLWNKAETFTAGTSFMAWASRVARYHVLNYRRKRSRDRLIFDEKLFEELCLRQEGRIEESKAYAEALRDCMRELPVDQQSLLELRYRPGGSVKQIAELRGQSVGAVSQMLYRIRESLLNSVARRLKEKLK